MGAIQCEICGSTNLIKQNGVFVCQGCGVTYSVEEERKLLTGGGQAPQKTSAGRIEICGNYIKFGNYGGEPILWRILAQEDNKILVISEKALDCKPYHTSYTDVTWDTCSLRTWLNDTFLNNAFSTAEQALIQNSVVPAHENSKYDTNPGNATADKVFLLSVTEAEQYFSSAEDRMCVLTAYAKAQGAYTISDCTKGGEATCWWWLRSPGFNQYFAADVHSGGSVGCSGRGVDNDHDCVHPALWLKSELLTLPIRNRPRCNQKQEENYTYSEILADSRLSSEEWEQYGENWGE